MSILDQREYHFAQESVAMGEILTAHIVTNENCADLATKNIYSGQKRSHLVSKVCMMFIMIDGMIWFAIWFPPYVFDGFVRVPYPREVKATDSHVAITGLSYPL